MIQKDILLGTLLGDASLQTYTKGKTYRLRFLQSDDHREYLWHLYSIFKDYCGTEPKFQVTKQNYKRWYFNTKTYDCFLEFSNIFYYENKKILNYKEYDYKIYEYCSPRSLAYWYMDDGYKRKNSNSGLLCTDNFSYEELEFLKELLNNKFNIHVSFHKKGPNHRIYIPSKSFNNFRNLIKPYIIESMKYKL